MNKFKRFISQASTDSGFYAWETEACVRSFLEIVAKHLKEEDTKFSLPGLGVFEIVIRPSRRYWDTKTGTVLWSVPRRMITWRPAVGLGDHRVHNTHIKYDDPGPETQPENPFAVKGIQTVDQAKRLANQILSKTMPLVKNTSKEAGHNPQETKQYVFVENTDED